LDTGFLLSGTKRHFIKVRVNIGATVIARMAAPIRENVLVSTSGANSFRSWPVRKRIGAKEMTMITTEKIPSGPPSVMILL